MIKMRNRSVHPAAFGLQSTTRRLTDTSPNLCAVPPVRRCHFPHSAMPLIEITEEEARKGVESLHGDLACLFADMGVPPEIRAVLGHVGLTTVADLANYETDEQQFREAMKSDIGLEPNNPKSRIAMGKLVESWKSSRNRLKAIDDEAAAARAQGRPAPLPETTFTAMRRGWQSIHGDRADHAFPSRYYINRRLRQLETGELRAERLSEVVTVIEGGDDEDDRDVDLIVTANSLRAQRKTVTVALPSNSEELRHRIDLMQVHWDVVVARHSDRRIFFSYDRNVWDRYVKHLLSDEIYNFRAKGQGLQWADLIEYEYKIRQKAIDWVNKGEKFLAEAMNDAIKCPDLKQLWFTLPLMTSGKRDASAVDHQPSSGGPANQRLQQEIKRLRNDLNTLRNRGGGGAGSSTDIVPVPSGGKGRKGKGKSKGKPTGAEALKALKEKERLMQNLPNNGGRLCYWYNIGHCSNGTSCNFHHACMRCGEFGHGVLEGGKCKKAPSPK